MTYYDDLAKKLMLTFNCPKCGRQIKYILDKLPTPNFMADNYSDSMVDGEKCIKCFSCSNVCEVDLYAWQGESGLEIKNIDSKYAVDEESIEVETLEKIK